MEIGSKSFCPRSGPVSSEGHKQIDCQVVQFLTTLRNETAGTSVITYILVHEREQGLIKG